MTETYRIERDSIQHRFADCRAKIQIFGGGYANGKTTALAVKVVRLMREYPGMRCLFGRATEPKMEESIIPVTKKWMPKEWVKRWPSTSNRLELVNGSTCVFRPIMQTGKRAALASQSNLLSATYDLIAIDQIDDPEISYKDFFDLLGRLRGVTRYAGTDTNMPKTGPRWIMVSLNPTRGWPYKKLVEPLHMYSKGVIHPDLIVDAVTGDPLSELFEGSTYTNAINLPEDYIKTLEATYTGQMRDRYLQGLWVAYDGLVYPMFDLEKHVIQAENVRGYFDSLIEDGIRVTFSEGYDYGMSSPSCYILAFTDHRRNTVICAGFYKAELEIEEQAERIAAIREYWGVPVTQAVMADPSLNKRTLGSGLKGPTVARLFWDARSKIVMARADNDIVDGVTRVRAMMQIQETKINPFTADYGGSALYMSAGCNWLIDELADYYWARDKFNETTDKPTDRRNHAADALRYLTTKTPRAGIVLPYDNDFPANLRWQEAPDATSTQKKARYA